MRRPQPTRPRPPGDNLAPKRSGPRAHEVPGRARKNGDFPYRFAGFGCGELWRSPTNDGRRRNGIQRVALAEYDGEK